MSQAPAMPVFTDALIGDTTHLSTEEFGAYCLILLVTWRNNGVPLEDNDTRMARICRVTEARWRVRIKPVLSQFFDLKDGVWRQKRLQKSWESVMKRVEANRKNGPLGGRPKALKTNETPKPNGFVSDNPDESQPKRNQNQNQNKEDCSLEAGASKESAIPPEPPPPPSPREVATLMMSIWNEECAAVLPKAERVTDFRLKHSVPRFRELNDDIEAWRGLCKRVAWSSFLTGDNDRGWTADLDWVIGKRNFDRITEGRYDNRINTAPLNNIAGGDPNRKLMGNRSRGGGLAAAVDLVLSQCEMEDRSGTDDS